MLNFDVNFGTFRNNFCCCCCCDYELFKYWCRVSLTLRNVKYYFFVPLNLVRFGTFRAYCAKKNPLVGFEHGYDNPYVCSNG
jgi:D-alanyl-lipoteichoic acid acyltransferase DltB (MBOAT superfamily)